VALRLARFNAVPTSHSDFSGLPCPIAAATLAAWVWVCESAHHYTLATFMSFSWVAVSLMVILAVLMLSTIRYPSFKSSQQSAGGVPWVLVMSLLLIICLALQPAWTLLVAGLVYILWGIFSGVWAFMTQIR